MPVIHSTGWKTVTLKIQGSEETLEIPVMIACKVWQLKCQLAEHLGLDHPSALQLIAKNGCSWKPQRNGDEVKSKLMIKGVTTFGKRTQDYPHPFGIIGGGHFGLRQAMHYERVGLPYVLFDRRETVGGNAWVYIANRQSRLQSEGAQYQLNYDLKEKEPGMVVDYGLWPSKQLILHHFVVTLKRYGCWPHIRLNTEVVDIIDIPESRGQGFEHKIYDFKLKSKSIVDDKFHCSCFTFYPGCFCVPHRKQFPGEDSFGGRVGYGFSNDFDYSKVKGDNIIIIGMGAFAAENVRITIDYGVKKSYIVARRVNLLLPRCISWFINQSWDPPAASVVLDAFKSMYALIGADPWSFHSVTANADRSMATIKQDTRWGIGDCIFLAIAYDKAEIVEGEVKRFKEETVVLTSGRILRDVKHVIKCLGFDGDFGVDRLTHAQKYIGFWPEGDFRRWCMCDQSSIETSRFSATALSSYGCTFTSLSLWYMQNVKDAYNLSTTGELPVGTADLERGSPGYHYEPRIHTAVVLRLTTYNEELTQFETRNNQFKKQSYWYLCPPEKFLEECKCEWYSYCTMFRSQGDSRPFPTYPYDVPFLLELTKKDVDSGKKDNMNTQDEAIQQAIQNLEEINEGSNKVSMLFPNSPLSFEPMKAVLRARSRSHSRSPSPQERVELKDTGLAVRSWLEKNTKTADYTDTKASKAGMGCG